MKLELEWCLKQKKQLQLNRNLFKYLISPVRSAENWTNSGKLHLLLLLLLYSSKFNFQTFKSRQICTQEKFSLESSSSSSRISFQDLRLTKEKLSELHGDGKNHNVRGNTEQRKSNILKIKLQFQLKSNFLPFPMLFFIIILMSFDSSRPKTSRTLLTYTWK